MARRSKIAELHKDGLLSDAAANDLGADETLTLVGGVGSAVADVATADADATYGTEEATLINELKDQVNALLAELRSTGTIAT